jgi:NADH:ubiquinone reductase (H+-translocating)
MVHDVVVLGAGYAGLVAAKRLANQVYADEVRVTLVSAGPDFVERPRLHQVAAGQRVRHRPLSTWLGGTHVRRLQGEVRGLDLERRRVDVLTADGRTDISYQTLVYALGSNIDVRTVPGVSAHALALTSRAAAEDARARLDDLATHGGVVTVCGGGLTGIEIATELAETYPTARTQLVSADEPGGWLCSKGQDYLQRVFDDLQIDRRTGGRISSVRPRSLTTDDGDTIAFDVCVWAGGFTVPSLGRESGLAVNASGRALVDSTLASLSHPEVYVIGDAAAVAGEWGEQLAMGCRSGGFTGPHVADVISARLSGERPREFRFRYVHECISLGRRRGLVQFLHRDEKPTKRILTGRTAVLYKNATLNAARLLFRSPGPYLRRRRHVTSQIADAANPESAQTDVTRR